MSKVAVIVPAGVKETREVFTLAGKLVKTGKDIKAGNAVGEELSGLIGPIFDAVQGAGEIPRELSDLDRAELEECHEAFRVASEEATATDESINEIVLGVMFAAKGITALVGA